MNSIITKLILSALLILIHLPIVSLAETETVEEETIVFGVAPFMSPLALVKRMSPLRDYLSQILGRTVVIETASHAGEFLQRSINGRYDYILTNPGFALKTYDSGKFLLLVTQKNKLKGQIVVMHESGIMKVNDLVGKTLGSPPKVGFLGQVIAPFVAGLGLIDENAITIVYFHSHKDSILALIDRTVDAVFIPDFMQSQLVKRGIKLREIASTEEYPGLIILSSSRRSVDEVERIKQALIALKGGNKSNKLLNDISFSPFIGIEANELEVVRKYVDGK